MANYLELEFSALERARDAFAKAPAIASEEFGAAMAEADALLATQAEAYTPVGAQNFLARSIFHEEQINEPGIIGVVASPMSYAEPVELGTKPHFPPLLPLIDWVVQKLDVPEKDARSVAFLVARKIAREGTKGQFMFRRAVEQQDAAVQAIFERALERFTARLAAGS